MSPGTVGPPSNRRMQNLSERLRCLDPTPGRLLSFSNRPVLAEKRRSPPLCTRLFLWPIYNSSSSTIQANVAPMIRFFRQKKSQARKILFLFEDEIEQDRCLRFQPGHKKTRPSLDFSSFPVLSTDEQAGESPAQFNGSSSNKAAAGYGTARFDTSGRRGIAAVQ